MTRIILSTLAELVALAGFCLAVAVWAALYIDLARV